MKKEKAYLNTMSGEVHSRREWTDRLGYDPVEDGEVVLAEKITIYENGKKTGYRWEPK